MAQILDPVPYPMQRSMVGTPLETVSSQNPEYMQRDTARRSVAAPISNDIYDNPNYPRGQRGADQRNYLAGGLPYDVEGLLSSVALKYGVEAAKGLLAKLPTMSRKDLMMVYQLVGNAASESDSMNQRERMAYERAGAPAR